MPTPAGTLQHLLVIANPGALTPYDPASTALPGEEHVFFTSRRRVDHPWIAQAGEGPNARPDISIGGQRLELPLGRTVDGECQVRVIDEPAPIMGIVCGIDVLIDEGHLNLNDGLAFSSGKWTIHESVSGLTAPGWFGINVSGEIDVSGFILFGSGTWTGYVEATLDGTEGGGPAWTPGQRVAVHFRVVWPLDTGPGNLFVETEGGLDPLTGDTVNRTSFPNGAFDFWTIDPALNVTVFNGVISAVTDASGELIIRWGGEGYGGSCNLNATLSDMQVVSCEEQLISIDSNAYMTANLADDDARQRLLGWPYYLKSSVDGGASWTEMVYAGYLKQATMERSKTFLLTGGDAGRGRRVSRAWAGLNPIEDFTP